MFWQYCEVPRDLENLYLCILSLSSFNARISATHQFYKIIITAHCFSALYIMTTYFSLKEKKNLLHIRMDQNFFFFLYLNPFHKKSKLLLLTGLIWNRTFNFKNIKSRRIINFLPTISMQLFLFWIYWHF